jgi:alkanesulfonate monooxygenase SsuD/methylene tetrahydromethanopterin reductase-like flavin-dependent oxidoreductase (luciferase family)
MDIGIGLPNPVPGTSGAELLEWVRRAERRGFFGLATLDRLVFPSYDSLTTLAAVAGATSRVRLLSNILLGPLYPAPLLAKAAASIDQLSGGRFTLGLGVGTRADDYAVAGKDMTRRGRDLDHSLELMHRAWRGEPFGDGQPICPKPTNGDRVPVLVGGGSDASLRRMATWGAGWTLGGSGPEVARQIVPRVRQAWADAGRSGEPRLAALTYFSLGEDAEDASRAYLRAYYGYLGQYTDRLVEGALRTPAAIRDAVAAYAEVGFTELYLDPTVSSPDQVDRLADVLF